MPIEIKEMHIKINVNEQQVVSSDNDGDNATDTVIQECLDQMSKMLNDKDER